LSQINPPGKKSSVPASRGDKAYAERSQAEAQFESPGKDWDMAQPKIALGSRLVLIDIILRCLRYRSTIYDLRHDFGIYKLQRRVISLPVFSQFWLRLSPELTQFEAPDTTITNTSLSPPLPNSLPAFFL